MWKGLVILIQLFQLCQVEPTGRRHHMGRWWHQGEAGLCPGLQLADRHMVQGGNSQQSYEVTQAFTALVKHCIPQLASIPVGGESSLHLSTGFTLNQCSLARWGAWPPLDQATPALCWRGGRSWWWGARGQGTSRYWSCCTCTSTHTFHSEILTS